MTPDRWERLEAICLDALEAPESDRAAFLAAACDGDAELLREAESLIGQHEPGFLEEPVLRIDDLRGALPLTDTTIGAYRIVRPLGRGGMGEVFLAIGGGDDFQQNVAIKIVRRGMDTEDVLQRFRMERRILASLNHPNIARMIDGGATNDGMPYFVMEYVDGVPLDRYCDGERLSIDERLRLFRQICHAVQHAHRNLVIHRDLKPANILVTGDGSPKLLDFGIGKLLSGGDQTASAETRPTRRMLTPEYAAPEQVRGDPVTTATDVYALGVVLYELLTGTHPYIDRDTAPHQVERAILETAPRAPSATVTSGDRAGDRGASDRGLTAKRLSRRLAGDLDTIILKALRKEPERRYTSPAALAEDIGRHLDGRPVHARPDSWRYRARKFAVRNPWGVAATAAAVLALGAVSAIPWISSRRAEAERDRALEVQGFLLETFGARGANRRVGDTPTARQLLDMQAARFEAEYADRPVLKAEMARVLAEGYERVGLYEEGEALALKALAMQRELSGVSEADIAATLNTVGWIQFSLGKTDEAEEKLRRTVEMQRRLGGKQRTGLARALNDLGVLRESVGDYQEAAALHQEALAIRREENGPNHRATAVSASNLAAVHYRLGDFESAVSMGRTALGALRASLGADHQRTIIAQGNLAAFRTAMGDLEGARGEYLDLLERQTRLRGRDHPNTLGLILSLATVHRFLGELEASETLVREAIIIAETRGGRRHEEVASALSQLARLLAEKGQFDEAVSTAREALDIHRAIYGEMHVSVAEDAAALATVLLSAREYEESERARRMAVRYFEGTLGPRHQSTNAQRVRLGRLLIRRDKSGEAIAVLEGVTAVAAEGAQIPEALAYEAEILMAFAHIDLNQFSAADSLLSLVRAADSANGLSDANRRRLHAADSMRAARAETGKP